MPASEDYTPLDTLKRYLSAPRRMVGEGLSSLTTLPQRAFQASEQMRTEGPYNPEPIVEAAMLPMGTGAIAGAPVRAGETALGAGPIRAYHSSPHDFERFDLSKIGTGEGAQVYGHGLYLAENPAVSGQGGQYWQQFKNRFSGDEGLAAKTLRDVSFDRASAVERTKNIIADTKDFITKGTFSSGQKMSPEYITDQIDYLNQHRRALKLLEGNQPVGPRTYEVNINADPAHMLNWDTKLGQQPPAVQDYFRKQIAQFGPEASMEAQYKIASSRIGGRKLAEGLTEAGVPGTRYLDEGSRSARPILKTDRSGNVISSEYTPQTSNYVVRDASILDIVKKYGLAGLAAPPAIAGAMNRENQP